MISRRCFVKTGVLAGASFYATFPATAARLLEETLDFPGAAAAAGARVGLTFDPAMLHVMDEA